MIESDRVEGWIQVMVGVFGKNRVTKEMTLIDKKGSQKQAS